MRNYDLKERDIFQISSLIKNNTNIYKLYSKLSILEIEGKKDSEEYRKYLDYLSIFTEVEEKIYKEAYLTLERILSWTKFLFNYKIINGFDIKEAIAKQESDTNTLVIYRILNILLTKITNNYNDLNKLPQQEITNIMTMIRMVNPSNFKTNETYGSILLNKVIEKDIFYSFLTFLQEFINDPKYDCFKGELITSKYTTIFLNKDIENYEMMNNFNIPSTIYVSSRMMSDLLKINLDTYKQVKNLYTRSILDTQIYELLEISDIDYNDISKTSSSILRQCMMKSAFLFMSDENISDSNYEFHEYIENEEYQDIHPNNNISINLIIHSFKEIKRNKSKMQILSLKK